MDIPGYALTLNAKTALNLELRKFEDKFEILSNELRNTLYSEFSTYQRNILETFLTNIESEWKLLEVGMKSKVEIDKESLKTSKMDLAHLNRRQVKVLDYLKEFDYITRREYTHMFDVNFMTAYRDLNELYKKKLIRVAGTGRGTRYYV